jgi:hypothetical protein
MLAAKREKKDMWVSGVEGGGERLWSLPPRICSMGGREGRMSELALNKFGAWVQLDAEECG